MSASPKIGVIIPAYNEAKVVGSVLHNLPKFIQHKGKKLFITPIVIDDGSGDDTAKVARTVPDTVVIQHILNSGAGAATRTGIYYLKTHNFTYGATMDADGQHAPEDLIRVLQYVLDNKGDLIIGSRLADTKDMPFIKIVGNKGLNFITRLLLGVSSSDSQSGLKALNRKSIEVLNYRENGYAFCSEMLWRAQKAGLSITDAPITAIYTDYSKSKGQSNWNAFQIIKQLIKHRIADIIHG